MSLASKILNWTFRNGDNKRDAGLTTPDTIERFNDIVYGTDPHWQVLDVYRPKKEKGNTLPVIVSVHGGGWVYGDKERYQFYCMDLAERGFAVVNFTYRLAPKYKYPDPLEDTNLVFSWVLDHADQYGFDKERIFAVGDSAGAHLLGLYCCICTNRVYAKEYSFQAPEGFVPTAAALNCGVYKTSPAQKGLISWLMKDFLPEKGTKEELQKINVLRHITRRFPPVLFMTCSDDFLKEQAPLLEARLKKLDVPYVSKYYGDEQNKLPHVFHCNIRSEAAKICNDDECEFFKGFCRIETERDE